MKRKGNFYPQIYAFENLWLAAKKAQKGKRTRTDVARFNLRLESELLQLRDQLQFQTYRPGGYRQFFVYEPKKRLISAAPYRDRVVHHALHNIIEPIFEPTFVFDSYACRKGKGTHLALNRFSQFAARYPYLLKADILKYFPSIDHQILKSLFRLKVKDPRALDLMDMIVDSSNQQEFVLSYFEGDDLLTPIQRQRGIPIGNLTSQFFANLYLNPMDHYIKEQLRAKAYLRYCDDFAIFSDDKAWLHQVGIQLTQFLAQRLRLKLHPKKSRVRQVKEGIGFLGFRFFPTYRRVLRGSVVRFRRRCAGLEGMKCSTDFIHNSVQSWLSHISWADTYGLKRQLAAQIPFVAEVLKM